MNISDWLFWGGLGGVILYGLVQELKKRRIIGNETAREGRIGSTSNRVLQQSNANAQYERGVVPVGGGGIGESNQYPIPAGYAGELFEIRQRVAQIERSFDEFNAEITRRLNRINARRRGTPADEPGQSDAGTGQADAFASFSGSNAGAVNRKDQIRIRAREKIQGGYTLKGGRS